MTDGAAVLVGGGGGGKWGLIVFKFNCNILILISFEILSKIDQNWPKNCRKMPKLRKKSDQKPNQKTQPNHEVGFGFGFKPEPEPDLGFGLNPNPFHPYLI